VTGRRLGRSFFRLSSTSWALVSVFGVAGLGLGGCRSSESPAPAAQASTPEPSAGGTSGAALGQKLRPEELAAPADVAAPPPGAERTPSGLASVVLRAGTGSVRPTLSDHVSVHYTGWTKDAQMFDSSLTRGRPDEFGVTEVITGWTEGLQLMLPGERRRFWIPAALAYGEQTNPGRPGGQLTFDVELVEIAQKRRPPSTPSDVAAPPASAQATASGLRISVLTPGNGKEHPSAKSHVKVFYAAWTQAGALFDCTANRGPSEIVAVEGNLPGWSEALQLMTVGEKARFWIPEQLAYSEQSRRRGAPAGPLTFEVELLQIL
jgi:FKBP-type peptidyl-prolyl cis-trans isomerase